MEVRGSLPKSSGGSDLEVRTLLSREGLFELLEAVVGQGDQVPDAEAQDPLDDDPVIAEGRLPSGRAHPVEPGVRESVVRRVLGEGDREVPREGRRHELEGGVKPDDRRATCLELWSEAMVWMRMSSLGIGGI